MSRRTLFINADGPKAGIVKARLREGYGAQDVLVMDGIPEAFFWSVVRDLEEKGRLRPLLRLPIAAE